MSVVNEGSSNAISEVSEKKFEYIWTIKGFNVLHNYYDNRKNLNSNSFNGLGFNWNASFSYAHTNQPQLNHYHSSSSISNNSGWNFELNMTKIEGNPEDFFSGRVEITFLNQNDAVFYNQTVFSKVKKEPPNTNSTLKKRECEPQNQKFVTICSEEFREKLGRIAESGSILKVKIEMYDMDITHTFNGKEYKEADIANANDGSSASAENKNKKNDTLRGRGRGKNKIQSHESHPNLSSINSFSSTGNYNSHSAYRPSSSYPYNRYNNSSYNNNTDQNTDAFGSSYNYNYYDQEYDYDS